MFTDILRKYQGSLSQGEYARRLNVSPATISYIYSGQRNPGMDVMRALAQKFPESADEIAAALSATTVGAEPEAVSA